MAHWQCVHTQLHVYSLHVHALDIKIPLTYLLQGIVGMYNTQTKVLQMFMLAYDPFVTHTRWQFV